jgi:hypothetical protein
VVPISSFWRAAAARVPSSWRKGPTTADSERGIVAPGRLRELVGTIADLDDFTFRVRGDRCYSAPAPSMKKIMSMTLARV